MPGGGEIRILCPTAFSCTLWRDLVSDRADIALLDAALKFPYALWRDLVSDARERTGEPPPVPVSIRLMT
jgi:hypothetical protein